MQVFKICIKQKVYKQLSRARLEESLILKAFLTLAYIICASGQTPELIPMPVFILLSVVALVLSGVVWHIYMPNIIKSGKVYQMQFICAKVVGFYAKVYGSIEEEGVTFPVVAYVATSTYHEMKRNLETLGTFEVLLSDREVEKEDKGVAATVYFK